MLFCPMKAVQYCFASHMYCLNANELSPHPYTSGVCPTALVSLACISFISLLTLFVMMNKILEQVLLLEGEVPY